MNNVKLASVAMVLASVYFFPNFGHPVPDENFEGLEGGVVTPPTNALNSAWQSAKNYFKTVQQLVGQTDQSTWLTRIAQATTFYTLVKDNPQGLVQAAKDALARALTSGLVNPQKAGEIADQAKVVEQHVVQANQYVRQDDNSITQEPDNMGLE